MQIDDVMLFDALANEMNAHHERFQILGDADMAAGVVMQRPDGDFRVRIDFEELHCAGVSSIDEAGLQSVDFWLEGPLDAWQAMFSDIVSNGRATGLQTINSLALLGDRIACRGDDPMGLDKFSRFNQTLQEFLDGAARVERAPAG